MEAVLDRKINIVLKGGRKLEVPENRLQSIHGDTIVRLRGTQEELADSGSYRKPFFVYNHAQQVHHAYSGPHDALRACVHTRTNGGTFDEDGYSEGEKQKLLAWTEQHRTLMLWLEEGNLSEQERERINAQCQTLAGEMGRPIDSVKCDILSYTLELTRLNDADAVQLLAEILGLDAERISRIEKIGNRVNWRAAIIAREIQLQQQAERDAAKMFKRALQRHRELVDTMVGRELHVEFVLSIQEHLAAAEDRPYIGLARHDARDIEMFHHEMVHGTFQGAEMYLRLAVAAHEQFHLAREIHQVLYRLSASMRQSKQAKVYSRERALQQLMRAKNQMSPADAPERYHTLQWSVYGRLNDALCAWRVEKPDFNEVKGHLKSAVKVLGG